MVLVQNIKMQGSVHGEDFFSVFGLQSMVTANEGIGSVSLTNEEPYRQNVVK